MAIYIITILTCMLAVGTVAFNHPHRVISRSALAAAGAVAFPFVAGHSLAPFLGDGAGMGVAAILYFCSAVVLLASISASAGAAANIAWEALRSRM